ncbi:MAG: hypothetical protein AB1486_27335 [Planctomycetota bacterium]
MRSRTVDATLSLLLLTAGLRAQQVPSPPVKPYPYEVVPVDALRGHLMEGKFKEPSGVFFDSYARELFVADTKNALIGIFDAEGTPLFTFGGHALLSDPKQVVALKDGTLYVLDAMQSSLKEFNYRGELRRTLPFAYPAIAGREAGSARIGAFTIDEAGNFYVADLDLPQVLVYDRNLEFKRAIGREGKNPFFSVITSVSVSPQGLIAVTDFKSTPVQIFDAAGRFVRGFGGRDIALEDFTAPSAVTFDEEGYLYAVDMLRHNVKIFDIEGHFLTAFGGWFGPATGGRAPGEMLYPSSIAIAPKGLIYVAERFGDRVQLFRRLPREPGKAAPRLHIPPIPPIEKGGPKRSTSGG